MTSAPAAWASVTAEQPIRRPLNLHLLGLRYYAPPLARFMSLDPIRSGRNWFRYPATATRMADPMGLQDQGPPSWEGAYGEGDELWRQFRRQRTNPPVASTRRRRLTEEERCALLHLRVTLSSCMSSLSVAEAGSLCDGFYGNPKPSTQDGVALVGMLKQMGRAERSLHYWYNPDYSEFARTWWGWRAYESLWQHPILEFGKESVVAGRLMLGSKESFDTVLHEWMHSDDRFWVNWAEHFYFHPYEKEHREEVNWSDIEGYFDEMAGDLVDLMDSCIAAIWAFWMQETPKNRSMRPYP